jgi:ribosome-binding factor A
MPSRRIEMLNEQFKREISGIVQRELRDPGISGLVSITSVEISPDLRHANVFVSVLGGQPEREVAVAALARASGFVRHELASRLTLRYTPTLTFRADVSIERGERIMELLREVAPKDAPKIAQKDAPKDASTEASTEAPDAGEVETSPAEDERAGRE